MSASPLIAIKQTNLTNFVFIFILNFRAAELGRMLATANSNRLEQLEGDPAGLLQPAEVIFFFEDTESIAFDPTQ